MPISISVIAFYGALVAWFGLLVIGLKRRAWGAFWLVRVMEFVLAPPSRNHAKVSALICIRLSAPLGILIAEFIRTRPVPDRAVPAQA